MDEVERLIEQLKSEDFDARLNATIRLGSLQDERAVPAVIEALKDEHRSVRSFAAWALGMIGDVSAVPPLIGALKDNEEDVQWEADAALKRIMRNWAVPIDASAVPVLIEALKYEDGHMRRWAIIVLEGIVTQCKTMEDIEKVEKQTEKYSDAVGKKHVDKGMLTDDFIAVAKTLRMIAKKKDELAPKRDLLLDDKPKPPKRGKGFYQTISKGNLPRRRTSHR